MRKKIEKNKDGSLKIGCVIDDSMGDLKQSSLEQEISFFNLVSSCISDVFKTRTTTENYSYRLCFLESKMVAKFCDCSNNFVQSKLVSKFKERNPNNL